jgi:3-hydroxymyristoyl/3-hydroxydecanoyl-(acyl carrier protein) dehydratase
MDAERSWNTTERRIDPAHPAADGHFPGNPIMPGAVLLDEIRAAIPVATCGLRAAKFLIPVRPGDRLAIRWTTGPAGVTFEAVLNGDRLAVSGLFLQKAGAP